MVDLVPERRRQPGDVTSEHLKEAVVAALSSRLSISGESEQKREKNWLRAAEF
jgi:hypothetical protein